MADESTATPRSTSEPHQLKAPKDKNCPFCGQAFTSSSLGRHLDLYIRQKNPKPADGVHLVDEIRKIRGGITRRQARSSTSVKKELGTPVSTNNPSLTGDASPVIVHSPTAEGDALVLDKQRGFQDVSWQSSAANNTPSRALGARTPDIRRDVSRHMQKAELDQRQKLSEDLETAKATELALRELLKSVREANAKASGLGLFDFDPYTLGFASLCLHILPAPSTLFSPTPFPTNESWSISPPGQKQFDALNRQVRERLLAYQRQRQMNQLYPPGSASTPPSACSSPLPTPPLFDPDPQKLFCHLADAYNHWNSLTDKQRQEAWQLEVLRSYARANDHRREAEVNLENARREIEQLKAGRWSSGGAELSPLNCSISPKTVKELGKHGMDFRNWDYDRLIDKWRSVVRDNKTSFLGMAAQKPLPNPNTRAFSMANPPTQSFSGPNGTRPENKAPPGIYSAPPTTNGTEASSDQADAEGEVDDAEDIDAEAASDSGSISTQEHGNALNNQFHGLPHQPTPIHPSQMHAQVQAQAQAQAQAHAHAQAQAHAQAHAQAQAQAQAQAWARQHMNQSRNQQHPHHHPHSHQHQQLSPHPQHIASAASSRRPSQVLMETHGLNAGGMLPMEGIEGHPDQFLRVGMSLADAYAGAGGDGV